MSGFAGLNKLYDSDQEEDTKLAKNALYEQITKTFNIFEFLENE